VFNCHLNFSGGACRCIEAWWMHSFPDPRFPWPWPMLHQGWFFFHHSVSGDGLPWCTARLFSLPHICKRFLFRWLPAKQDLLSAWWRGSQIRHWPPHNDVSSAPLWIVAGFFSDRGSEPISLPYKILSS